MIFNNLNKCVVRGNFIDGEVWIPNDKFFEIQTQLREITNRNESRLTANFYDIVDDDNITPPTYIKSNDFTWAFQNIVDTYGVPRYREINPTLFNIVTFPFLFGVMYGDIGHGGLLFLGSLYLVLNYEELSKNPTIKPILKARWLFLMMGFFATYVGWIYNDFLSLPINVFGSCYTNNYEEGISKHHKGCTYPFGVDPRWYVANNELTYFNSFKMKFAVIIGVLQMSFGIVLRGVNALHFGNKIDFIFEFLPQIVFMGLLFGYMNVMIMIKWCTDYWVVDTLKSTATEIQLQTYKAPSIITQLMQIFLKFGDVVSLLSFIFRVIILFGEKKVNNKASTKLSSTSALFAFLFYYSLSLYSCGCRLRIKKRAKRTSKNSLPTMRSRKKDY
jgi:V-type H+-transporting ATPase subunit a